MLKYVRSRLSLDVGTMWSSTTCGICSSLMKSLPRQPRRRKSLWFKGCIQALQQRTKKCIGNVCVRTATWPPTASFCPFSRLDWAFATVTERQGRESAADDMRNSRSLKSNLQKSRPPPLRQTKVLWRWLWDEAVGVDTLETASRRSAHRWLRP